MASDNPAAEPAAGRPPTGAAGPADGEAARGKGRRERASLLRLLRTHLRPYIPLLIGVVVLEIFSAAMALFLPTLNARIIDDGIARGDTDFILRSGGLMLLVTVAQAIGAVGVVYCAAKAATSVGRDLRSGLYHQVTTFSDREFAQFGTPSLITRNTNDVQQIQMLVMISATILTTAPIMSIGGVVMALRENARLSWLLVISVPLLLGVVTVIMALMVPLYRRMQARIDGVNRVMREQLTGMRVVRAFVREQLERDKFDTANSDLTSVALSAGRLFAMMMPAIMIISNLTSVAVLWFAAHLIDDGEMQVGQMTAFIAYVMQILSSVMMAVVMAVLVPRAAVSAERISEVLRTESSVRNPRDPKSPSSPVGVVEFSEAAFGYPGADEPVLSDLTFSCRPGTTTAIVGSTGSGKSTLLSLIPRLFDATAGSVLVDGIDVRLQDQDTMCRSIGLVPQRAYLFSGTVASNLRFGKPDATEDEMWEALRISQAEQFVRALPEGLDAPVSQGGTNFSGGQRQRLTIARAVVRRPLIYLFDDSFSALDLSTEAALYQALSEARGEATVITVSQRVARIAQSDQIVVLEDGRTVGVGSHQDLVVECPTYWEIVQSQQPTEVEP
ncbi:ABC transporter ATP-binding protein [Tomitella fengzijianii]|uniref:ABC transporter ATP-binding protein n=1 Tax=Tomitella fengzijianii TaxID=2597660 RepID=A0A516X427_9ACTN|nr:ABC transporter ATP-binding protein [Tomitella fengzijianii]QDQ97401.1 ABC transporter ATP-binding protein [Tomitella fengzijianii]